VGAAAASSKWLPPKEETPDELKPKVEAAEGATAADNGQGAAGGGTASSKAEVQTKLGQEGRVTEDGHGLPGGRRPE
jgi:hypothetical protein